MKTKTIYFILLLTISCSSLGKKNERGLVPMFIQVAPIVREYGASLKNCLKEHGSTTNVMPFKMLLKKNHAEITTISYGSEQDNCLKKSDQVRLESEKKLAAISEEVFSLLWKTEFISASGDLLNPESWSFSDDKETFLYVRDFSK